VWFKGEDFLAVIQGLFHVLIGVIELAFLLRAVLSWFQDGSGDFISTAYEVMYTFTEPFVIPMRMLLDRFSFARSMPIDLAFFFTFLLISLIGTFM